MSRGVSAECGPWIDLHGHAGRCFLAGLPTRHPMVTSLGAASVTDAVRAARAAGMTALSLATVSDFGVLRPDPVTGLRAYRDFRPGEAYAGHRRQLEAVRRAVAAAGAEVATSAADVGRAARDGRTVVLLGCEGGDFLDGDLRRLEEARAAGVSVLTLVHYRVNEIGDVQTEAPVHGRRRVPAGVGRQVQGGHGKRSGKRFRACRGHSARSRAEMRAFHLRILLRCPGC